MTQEDKDLLLKDICSRIPYGVKFTLDNGKNFYYITGINLGVTDSGELEYFVTAFGDISPIEITHIKPYLRPMNSMTEEEREYLSEELGFDENLENGELNDFGSYVYNRVNVLPLFDWLNKNMFDYRGLIPMGLALEAPEGMYK